MLQPSGTFVTTTSTTNAPSRAPIATPTVTTANIPVTKDTDGPEVSSSVEYYYDDEYEDGVIITVPTIISETTSTAASVADTKRSKTRKNTNKNKRKNQQKKKDKEKERKNNSKQVEVSKKSKTA